MNPASRIPHLVSRSFLKTKILPHLPRSVVQTIRCWRAPRVVAGFSNPDWPEAALVRSLVKSGDTVIDAGANMGYITARLADYVGKTGCVIALEPVPETFALLSASVKKLRLTQVVPMHACVSNRPGTVTMAIPCYEQGGENLYESHVTASDGATDTDRRVSVNAITLDSLLDDVPGPVTFVKIDTEGHELAVIQGAARLIRRDKPALFIEVSGNPDESESQAAQLFQTLAEAGYQAHIWNGTALHPRKPGDTSVDYVFLAGEKKSM